MKVIDKKRFVFVCILLVSSIFMMRILYFVSQNGGVEHDSGWYLGVAKNLGLRGIYASYTNTIRENEVGAHPSIHGRFSVQDENGFIYFPAGVTVGPGYVVPEAIFIKIFGSGFWQYRMWPLIAFFLLLMFLFYCSYRLGGFTSIAFFSIWLWMVPQLYTTFSFEAYGEDIALLFLLVGYFLYVLSFQKKKKLWIMVLSGGAISLSILTKNLFIIPASSIVIGVLYEIKEFFKSKKKKRQLFIFSSRWSSFVLGYAIPWVGFTLYKYYTLFSQFGASGVKAVDEDFRIHFQTNGSGIENFSLNIPFIFQKLSVWATVGIKYPLFFWVVFIISSIILIKKFYSNNRLIVFLLLGAVYISFAWYIVFSPFGWARHVWQGLVLGMMLISIVFSISLKKIIAKKSKWNNVIFVLFILGVFSVIQFKTLDISPLLTINSYDQWQNNRFITGLQGLPPMPIMNLNDQKNLVSYFQEKIKPNDTIYYAGWFLVAEASPLVDKVFYSFDRYFTLDQKNALGGKSYMIFGPYQQGKFSIMPSDYLSRKLQEYCQNVVFQNSSYTLCILKHNLVYNNPAYN